MESYIVVDKEKLKPLLRQAREGIKFKYKQSIKRYNEKVEDQKSWSSLKRWWSGIPSWELNSIKCAYKSHNYFIKKFEITLNDTNIFILSVEDYKRIDYYIKLKKS